VIPEVVVVEELAANCVEAGKHSEAVGVCEEEKDRI